MGNVVKIFIAQAAKLNNTFEPFSILFERRHVEEEIRRNEMRNAQIFSRWRFRCMNRFSLTVQKM